MSRSEQQLSARLRELVPEPTPVLDIDAIKRAGARRRRRRAISSVVSVLVLLAAGVVATTVGRHASPAVSSDRLPAVQVRYSNQLRPYVRNAELTRPVSYDGGELRLFPPTAQPAMSEARAVALFRASSPPDEIADNVVVFLANATVRTVVATSATTLPRFVTRATWVVAYDNGPHSCPAMTTDVLRPGTVPLALIAADDSGQGLSYQTRGAFCGGPPTGPFIRALPSIVSVPWQIVRRDATTVTIRPTSLPRCGSAFQANLGANLTVTLWAGTTMNDYARCARTNLTTTFDVAIRSGAEPEHGQLGLITGYGAAGGFSYYDGTWHGAQP